MLGLILGLVVSLNAANKALLLNNSTTTINNKIKFTEFRLEAVAIVNNTTFGNWKPLCDSIFGNGNYLGSNTFIPNAMVIHDYGHSKHVTCLGTSNTEWIDNGNTLVQPIVFFLNESSLNYVNK